jgi:hypothetical protein
LFEPLQSHPSVPTRNLSRPSRAGPVKNGRRADRRTRRLISRPLLDWPEHDGRLGRVGITVAARQGLSSRDRAAARLYRQRSTDIKQLSTSVALPVV